MVNSEKQEMQYIADLINETFESYDLPVVVKNGVRTSTIDRFNLIFKPGTKFSSVKKIEDELAIYLGVSSVKIDKDEGGIFIEVSRKNSTSNNLVEAIENIKTLPPFVGLVGLSSEGKVLALRLDSSEAPHVGVIGGTGSGKTVLFRSLLTSLAYFNSPQNLEIVLIDPKGRGLKPLEVLPHVKEKVISDAEAAIEKIKSLVLEMEKRDKKNISSPRIIVAIDELNELAMVNGEDFLNNITRIAQRGRQAGINIIFGSQKASATLFGGNFMANIPIKLVGKTASKRESTYASNISGLGAEKLKGKGDFYLVNGDQVVRFMAFFLDSAGFSKLGKGK